MKKYTLYTEDKPNLAALTGDFFDGFTILRGDGYWKRIQETCALIIIITEDDTRIHLLADKIKRENNQESVLITASTLSIFDSEPAAPYAF